ncbi:MAG: hypothetical protein ABI718_17420, partial [Acidobacteriota bacterium]
AVSAFPAAPLPPQPSMYDPALSPDGSQIAFVSGGDIWTVPSAGGQARLLVSHPATESRPLFSPDGKSLAFVSTRTGNGDIYVMSLTTGQLARITWDDGFNQLDNWSADGKWLYFNSNTADISGMNDIYRVSVSGGTPMAVSADRYVNEYFSAPSPDGSTLAFAGHGIGSSQWWRHGHSHIDESEIWLLTLTGTPSYRKLTAGGAKELWPMWNADGTRVFYMSDNDGSENIWATSLDGKRSQITHFKNGRLIWPSISADGRKIVFERDFGSASWTPPAARRSQSPLLFWERRQLPTRPTGDTHEISMNWLWPRMGRRLPSSSTARSLPGRRRTAGKHHA